MTETINNAKEAIVDSVQNVSTTLTEKIGKVNGEFIPLKDAQESANHALEENMENIKNDMLTKSQAVTEETDQMADELIKDTEDVLRDAETGIVDISNSVTETMESMKSELSQMVDEKSPTHSTDSLKTSNPEPEIERLLIEATNPTSPEPTQNELEILEVEVTEKPSEDDEPKPETESESNDTESEPTVTEPEDELKEPAMTKHPSKEGNDLVVEDVKTEE